MCLRRPISATGRQKGVLLRSAQMGAAAVPFNFPNTFGTPRGTGEARNERGTEPNLFLFGLSSTDWLVTLVLAPPCRRTSSRPFPPGFTASLAFYRNLKPRFRGLDPAFGGIIFRSRAAASHLIGYLQSQYHGLPSSNLHSS
ncbi:hypothetical protein PAPYR_5899 [Paratrimastix pyriformis]|uniref:Uncharacterized protein n=1 Tax=Paratrimastix pyriformis TaxID=342808 RepID=A0ABQ8UGH3_9EUKA|nr:hypothetical protein PAPYR_5899 [Paratrimastix pyriformis]